MISNFKLKPDTSWDFRQEDTKYYSHCFHNYPAMMIPQVASRLIDLYGKNAKILFDPYCGTGTSLVEANIRNINAIGTDINPLARLISKVKTTPIFLEKLHLEILNFRNCLSHYFMNIPIDFDTPDFNNILYWFSEEVITKLSVIKKFIYEIENNNIKNFFRVCFSETIRDCSWTRNGEFKLYRMTDKQIKNFSPDVFSVILNKISRNLKGLEIYQNAKKNMSSSEVYDFNSVKSIPDTIIPDNSIDLVVTSPPYGDSRTTVAYGQFSRLSNQWLDVSNASEIDKISMGGTNNKNLTKYNFKPLDNVIEDILKIDSKRAFEVNAFYHDYLKSINNISKKIKPFGYVCYVVGNRTVKSFNLPTDKITQFFFENNNFSHIYTYIRNIPNKRMPSKNSPTNITGEIGNTMLNEYIVVLQKK
ncbi:MAG: site-specific DNA-methyltransferase [Spirochaetia bacterium]|nr:site-specific DNA-methyltransferase [Spirochaetia bacterium]